MEFNDVSPENSNTFSIRNRRRCQRYILRIQRRLDQAVADSNITKIRHLSYLLGKRSKAVKILSIFRVCKENEGRYTAGVDGFSISEYKETATNQMLKLLNEIDITSKPKPIRRVLIPKPNSSKKRPLGIPTIRDRINQDIIKTAIEPICEYHFLPCSHGFRPKRSCHDAIADIFGKLARKGSRRWIVEGDIKGCFDNIKHSHILETLTSWKISSWITALIEKILKSGGKVGTPQGGVISPMLANVALTCLDNRVNKMQNKHGMNPLVRYADDFIVVAEDEEGALAIKEVITDYLQFKVGLELSDEKTRITEISEGFDFLGFNIRKYREKLLIKPAKSNIADLRYKIKKTVGKFITAEELIRKLNPIITGWGNYYRHGVSKYTFKRIDDYIFERIYKWIRRKHSERSNKWLIQRYYRTVNNFRWGFIEQDQILNRLGTIPIKRFVKVNKEKRVYNMEDKDYWHKREYINARDSIYYSYEYTKLFREQDGKCVYCEQPITQKDIQERNAHKHHLIPTSKNGEDELSNLRLIHKSCHVDIHKRLSLEDMASYMRNGLNYLELLSPT